jgi:hypothetical protein
MILRRVRTSFSTGHRRKHLEVTYCRGGGSIPRGWCLQWAHPTAHGYRFDDPIRVAFRTKREATEYKRRMLASPTPREEAE